MAQRRRPTAVATTIPTVLAPLQGLLYHPRSPRGMTLAYIWQALSNGAPLWFARVPNEFYGYRFTAQAPLSQGETAQISQAVTSILRISMPAAAQKACEIFQRLPPEMARQALGALTRFLNIPMPEVTETPPPPEPGVSLWEHLETD